jgi:hypothetical protein
MYNYQINLCLYLIGCRKLGEGRLLARVEITM